MGRKKLGQPVPDSNLVFESKSAVPQHTHSKTPSPSNLSYSPLNAYSVPARRATWKARGESCARHSTSVFTSLGTGVVPSLLPDAANCSMVTIWPAVARVDESADRERLPSQPAERSARLPITILRLFTVMSPT